MARKFTKYPQNITASNRNESPSNWSKIPDHYKRQYNWSGAQLIATTEEGEWFIVENRDEGYPYYIFTLLCVYPDGEVDPCKQRRVDKETYTSERAYQAMDELEDDYRLYYA